MKKSYAQPVMTPAGTVLQQTQSGITSGSELAQPLVKFRMGES
jgi:hypothetical protein